MEKHQLLNGANLAYLGDAYYELYIRKYLIDQGITKNHELKKASLKFVSASSHQKIFDLLKEDLTEEENSIFLRGRNGASLNHRKNLNMQAYLTSSGLEAIIGYLFLKQDWQRLEQLMQKIIKIGECL